MRLRVVPTAEVYVCLIDIQGRRLVNGVILQAGQAARTFRSRRFRITLGNANARLVINGRARTVPQTVDGIGYEITKAKGRRLLSGAERPTCGG